MLDNSGVTTTLHTIANRYIDDGYTVLKVAPDKRPIGSWSTTGTNRFDHTNRDSLALRDATAIGIVTGPSGLFVIDIDDDTALAAWISTFGEINTRAVKTPRGMHLYYLAPDGKHKPQQGIMPGIDVRAGESYVIAPGSTITGGSYSWANNLSIAGIPAEILAVAQRSAKSNREVTALAGRKTTKHDKSLSEAYDQILAMNPSDDDLDDIIRCPIDEIEAYAANLIIADRMATRSRESLAI
jgi:hypothetical protein